MNALGELRLYLKIRPDVAQLRKLFGMHISVNVAGQIVLTILHMLNIFTPVVPPKYKFLAMAVIGALNLVLSILAHYSNPDGTPASEPFALTAEQLAQYQKLFATTAKLFVLAVVLGRSAQAEPMARFYATGATFEQYSHPELTGWAAMALPLDQARQNWSFTEYDVTASREKPAALQTSVRTGFATQVKAIGPLRIFAIADGGYATANNAAGGAVGGGFLGFLPLGKKKVWNLLGAYRILKTSVASGSPKFYQLGFGRTF